MPLLVCFLLHLKMYSSSTTERDDASRSFESLFKFLECVVFFQDLVLAVFSARSGGDICHGQYSSAPPPLSPSPARPPARSAKISLFYVSSHVPLLFLACLPSWVITSCTYEYKYHIFHFIYIFSFFLSRDVQDDDELNWMLLAKQGKGVSTSEKRRESAETEYYRLLCEESTQKVSQRTNRILRVLVQ